MKFGNILGQEDIKKRLQHMVDGDRIPHAILLSGDAGTPKLALAQAFVQYIHCSNKTNGDSCGKCPSCLQHQTFNHADTFYSFPIIKKASPRKETSDDYIDQWKIFLSKYDVESFERWLSVLENENAQPMIYVKESDNIIHKMSLSSYSSKYKVLIMWLPEKMREDCANKLLKIIEEPFPDSLFVFVSDNPKAILPTIYSRTQPIEIGRLSNNSISVYLQKKYHIDAQDALAAASQADGNVVQAEESLIADSENKEFFKQFIALMRLAYSRDLKSLKVWSEEITAYKREKARRFLSYAARMIRENFIYNLKDRNLNYLTREEESFSARFAPFINEENVMRLIQEFDRAYSDISGNANGKIVLFDLAIKITILIKR